MPTEITVHLLSSIDWVDLVSSAVTAAVTIIALFIGARISRKAEIEAYNRKFLSESFSDVLARYSLWLEARDDHTVALFYAAAEKARLLCTQETESLLKELENKVANGYKPEDCAITVTRLRKAMKAELNLPKKMKKRLHPKKGNADHAQNQIHRTAD